MLPRAVLRRLLALGAFALIGSAAAAAAAAAPAPAVDLAGYYALPSIGSNKVFTVEDDEGLWSLREAEPVIIALYACGAGDFCGRIAVIPGWLADPHSRNWVPADRDRKLCGVDVLWLKHAANASQRAALWTGKFYDPRLGDTSSVAVSIDANGNLTDRRRGQGRTPFASLWRDGMWRRVPPPAATCEQAQPAR